MYKNYARSKEDLLIRIGIEGGELERSPHTISHTTAKGETIKTHALKVVTTAENSDVILEELIDALMNTPAQYANSMMDEFKLVPFGNTSINKYGITELIVQ